MNKELPNNIQVEQEVLGDMLTNKRNVSKFIEKLNIQDFYNDKHKRIFKNMLELFAEGRNISLTMLIEKVGKNNLETVGGITYLTDLSCGAIPLQPQEYIKVLKEKSFRRKSIREMQKALRMAYDDEKNINEVVGNMSNSLLENESNGEMLDDKELIERGLNEIEKRMRNGGQIPGMKTGLKSFDIATGGLERGRLNVIGARPAMGKSAFSLRLGDGLAQNGYKVGNISMEMMEEELAMRRLAAEGLVEMNKLKFGTLNDDDFIRVANATNKITKTNNMITDCSPYQTILTIKSKAIAMKQSKGLDVLIIDHLGLISLPNSNKSQTTLIGEVTRALKQLAKELDISVILLCQLSRACEQRADHRPMLSDLRESGNIEQDSDNIIFLYRDDYYNQETEDKDILEVIISKQRNGSVGTLKLAYKKEYQLITDLEKIF